MRRVASVNSGASRCSEWSFREEWPTSVFLDVVWYLVGLQGLAQAARGAAEHAVPGAEAAHDRAGPGEQGLSIVGHSSVVDARGVEAVAWREQQRESGAHAEADHSYLASTTFLLG